MNFLVFLEISFTLVHAGFMNLLMGKLIRTIDFTVLWFTSCNDHEKDPMSQLLKEIRNGRMSDFASENDISFPNYESKLQDELNAIKI